MLVFFKHGIDHNWPQRASSSSEASGQSKTPSQNWSIRTHVDPSSHDLSCGGQVTERRKRQISVKNEHCTNKADQISCSEAEKKVLQFSTSSPGVAEIVGAAVVSTLSADKDTTYVNDTLMLKLW